MLQALFSSRVRIKLLTHFFSHPVVAHLEDQLGREINYLALTPAELAQRLADGDLFTRNVLTGPKVMLIGDEDALRKATGTAPHHRPVL